MLRAQTTRYAQWEECNMKLISLVHMPAVALSVFASSALAAPILDQSFVPVFGESGSSNTGVISTADQAQTFTVGATGVLSKVDVFISKGSPPGKNLLFDVRPTVGGVPVESDTMVLAVASVPGPSVPATPVFFEFDISSFNVPVTSGEVLAIVLRSDNPDTEVLWNGAGP